MLSFFRRALSSWLVLGLLGLLMIAFIVTGVGAPTGFGGGGSVGSGDTIVTVGSEKIKASELERQAKAMLDNIRQQNPSVTMAAFLAQGGLDQLIRDYSNAEALAIWGRQHGFAASDRLIDGDIASIPAFKNPAGKFDETVMREAIRRAGITEQELRTDIMRSAIARQIQIPIAGGSYAPNSLILPYASVRLEQRSGLVGIIPAAAIPAGAAPTDAEIQQYYRRNVARFTYPERRALRYALFGAEQIQGSFAATDAEIQQFYRANTATYGGSETRSFAQVVLPDQAAANAFAAKVRGGTPFAAAAQQAGFSAADTAIADVAKPALATRTSAAVANAAFGAAQGALVGPVRSDFGWHVIRVESIRTVAAKPLASVRAEIAAAVERQKRDEALSNMVASVQDAIDDGSTFDDVVRSEKLTVVTTPPLLPTGAAPGQPDYRPAPEVQLLLRSAQQLGADDDPAIETIGAGQRYALLAVSQVVPATPAPIAQVRQQVIDAIVAQRRASRVQTIAQDVLTKVKRGMPMAQALREAGIPLPPPQPAQARAVELERAGAQAPRPLTLMFSMRVGETRVVPAENDAGVFVVSLQGIRPGDAAQVPQLIEATGGEISGALADEYASQFSNAVARDVGVKRDAAAIARLRTQLTGGAAQ